MFVLLLGIFIVLCMIAFKLDKLLENKVVKVRIHGDKVEIDEWFIFY